MTHPNYRKGRRKEYKIRRDLLINGYDIAQRSAGSHSPIDIFAISKKNKEIALIQAKPDSMSEKEKKALEESLKWLNGAYSVRFWVE